MAPEAEKLVIEKGELAWHDWGRSLKIRKPTGISISGGVCAFDKSKDAFHPEAFAGTGVEHLIAPTTEPRKAMFDAIDWCGNVIGQIEDCPFGPIGRSYDVQNLGLMYAFYKVVDYGLELLPDDTWHWFLLFAYDQEAASADYQRRNADPLITD